MTAEDWSDRFARHISRRIDEDPELAAQVAGSYRIAIDGGPGLLVAIETLLAVSTERAPCGVSARIQARELLQLFNGTLSGGAAVTTRRLVLSGKPLNSLMLATVIRLFRPSERPVSALADYMSDPLHGILPSSGLAPDDFSESVAIEALGAGGGYWRIGARTRARVRPADGSGTADLWCALADAEAMLAGSADPVQLFARLQSQGISERARGLAVLLADRRLPTGEVSGRILDQHGQSHDEILVSVAASRGGDLAAQTRATGSYRLCLPTGPYQLVFESAAFAKPVIREITIDAQRLAEVDVVIPRSHTR
jgi:hypothetical protein